MSANDPKRTLSHTAKTELNRKIKMPWPCPCCGYLTYDQPPSGSYGICPVCFWEDDPVQNEDPTFEGGANNPSLNQAKENYKKFSAIEERFVSEVRRPLPKEIPQD